MTSCQMGSLNELEQTRLLPSWKKYLKLDMLPQADTMGDVASKMDSDQLRSMMKSIYRQLKRNKALKSGFHDNLTFLVVDGHESSCSYLRSCEHCLEREVSTAKGPKTQYYHRYAGAMLISAKGVCIPLDIEMQQAGEDEVACATRLIHRLCQYYPRAFDVVMADGLYARASFFKTIVSLGKQAVAVLKDDRRELIKEARSRCAATEPYHFVRENGAKTMAWDLEDCRNWMQLDMPVRVVRTIEKVSTRRQETGEIEESISEWLWVATIPKKMVSTEMFVEVAHHRWDIENKEFNELCTYWHLDHVYKHDLTAIIVFTLMTLLSYTLFNAFLLLNLKPALRQGKTKKHFARRIMAAFYAIDALEEL